MEKNITKIVNLNNILMVTGQVILSIAIAIARISPSTLPGIRTHNNIIE